MSFELKRRREQPDLRATLEEYQDTQTGMKHIHLRRNDAERGFVLMFPTPPSNDKGIPHILEHLSLCGSEKYPIRDPFFAMQNRSMASFMNAMTGSDYTLYPFATTNEKDYWNLMGIYADATFFPNLHAADFRQEGWRPTLVTENDQTRVEIQGVVFNEMIGSLNGRDAQLRMATDRVWYKGSAKEYVSGGDPLSIPDLSYEELKKFHEDHYHPSRAIVLTYGDYDAQDVQVKVEEWVLNRKKWDVLPPLDLNHHLKRVPQHVEIPVPVEGDPQSEHSLMLRWNIPFNTVDDEIFGLAINSLLFSSAGDMAANIVQSQLARLGDCVFSNDGSESFFQIELEGLCADEIQAAQSLIESEIKKVLKNGFQQTQINATLRDFEFQQRSTGKNGGLPFGIFKLYEMGVTALFGRDPEEALLSSDKIERLRIRLNDPDVLHDWVKNNLDRTPDLIVHAIPDPNFNLRLNEKMQARLTEETANLNAERKSFIEQKVQELMDRQNNIQDPECLPGMTVSDMDPLPLPDPVALFKAGDATKPAEFLVTAPTNGQAFISLNFNLNNIPVEDVMWMNLLFHIMDSVGVENRDWVETVQWQNESAAMFATSLSVFGIYDNDDAVGLEGSIQVGGLQHDAAPLAHILWTTINNLRLDEEERIEQLIVDLVDRTRQSISALGDNWSNSNLSGMINSRSALQDRLQGRDGFRWLDEVNKQLDHDDGFGIIANHLTRVYDYLKKSPVLMLVASDNPEETIVPLRQIVAKRAGWETVSGPMVNHWKSKTAVNEALMGKTGVQYMRQVWRVPTMHEEHAGDLAVLSKLLTMDVLLPALREKGGAYGASAVYIPNGVFTMSTYRDPRLAHTLQDFDKARYGVFEQSLTKEQVDAAIVMVCRSLDAPQSPAMLSNSAWLNAKSNATRDKREKFRQQVLAATPKSLQKAAQRFLSAPPLAMGGFISENRKEEAVGAGLVVYAIDPQEKPNLQSVARMKV